MKHGWHKQAQELITRAKARGWCYSRTSKGHIRLFHERASRFVITSGTPSDVRAWKNAVALMNRLVPA
ncbi:hypothetical protein [Acetobacter sp.]|uniref:hypothetical protein n=1 Tax=Acetobacter sp. TaxID=440 RepID=UPI0039EADE53